MDAHQVIVSVEVGPEDKDAGIEAIWPAGICTNIVIQEIASVMNKLGQIAFKAINNIQII